MQNFSWARDGRRERRRYGPAWKALDYLARIAINNDIDPNTLFNTLVDAWKNEESTYENLVIRRRKKTRDSAVFLFKIDDKVTAQLLIPEQILQGHNPIKSFIDSMPVDAFSVKADSQKKHRIKDLKPGMKHVNLSARVLEIPESKLVSTRLGTTATVSNILIGDETGTIRLPLWNEQIKTVSIDDIVQIENAHIVMFRGEQQLRLGRSRKLNIIEEKGFPTKNKLIRLSKKAETDY